MFKAVLVVCAQALLLQSAFACGIGAGLYGGNGFGYGLGGAGLGYNGLSGYGGYGGYGAGCGCGVASTGGGLPIASASSFAPVGVSVLSDNVYEGTLAVGGNLPFLGTVSFESVLPTAGAGAVSYGCGNGAIGIGAEEGPIVTGIAAPGTYAPGIGAINGFGYGAGLGCGAGYGYGGLGGIGYGAGLGCGCGGLY